ncbi:MAG: hypothetical protein NW206_09680 [Hyphomonadaceae bacterium]|nr:hypothetical protein [Hyphomonadaceae bacterium]
MTNAEWRALIEAYLDGRLSAEAFMRRFMDGWRVSRARGVPILPPIEALQVAVEAFESEVTDAQEDGAVNDDDLRQAAQRALSELEEYTPTAQTYDRARTREEMRRFQIQFSGCAGFGCLFGAIWLGLCLLQVYYVSEFIQRSTDWGAWPSAVVGFVLAFVPLIGNVLAYAGATNEGWPSLVAAIVFFAAPAAALFSGWSRWRRLRR